MKKQKLNSYHYTLYKILSGMLLISFLATSCTSSPSKSSSPVIMEKEYRMEGFIHDNTYRVFIIRPMNSKDRVADIQQQAQKRAFISLQKYLASQGRRLTEKSKPVLLNLISEKGSLTEYVDPEHLRKVYTFDIKEKRLRSHINDLGI